MVLYFFVRHATRQIREKETALTGSEEQLRLLLNSTAEAIYGIDLDGNCTFCNPACLRLLGYTQADELIGKNMHWLIHHTRSDGAAFPIEECRIFRAFRQGEGAHVDDEVLWRANGTSFPAEYRSYPQHRNGQIVGAVVKMWMATCRLPYVAVQLTSIHNHKFLNSFRPRSSAFMPESFQPQLSGSFASVHTSVYPHAP